MINAVGHLAERYESTPYGGRQVYRYNPWKGVRGDMNGDGNVDSFDTSPFTTATSDMASYHTSYPDLDGYARADLNDDGAVDSFDVALFNAFLAGERDELESAPTLRSYRNGNGMTLNDIGHQGLMHDEELGTSHIHNRARYRSGQRFHQRDPLGYVDGMGLYEYLRSNPLDRIDPEGRRNSRTGSGSGSGSRRFVGWVSGLLEESFDHAVVGFRTQFQCCMPTPIPAVSACVIIRIEAEAFNCCKGAEKKFCVSISTSADVGLFATATARPGCTVAREDAKGNRLGYPPIGSHGWKSSCPPDGKKGFFQVNASIGVGSWTLGARARRYFPDGRWVVDGGLGYGYGTGVSGGGGVSFTKCIDRPF